MLFLVQEFKNIPRILYNKNCFFTFFLVCISFSCKNSIPKSDITQGVIQYEINYIDHNKKLPIQLMPKTMVLSFNTDFSSFSIEDPLGLFNVKNIHNHIDNNHITLVKIWKDKYYYIGKTDESPILFNPKNDFKFKFIKDTTRLVGFLCNIANVSDKNLNFDIYYTNDIYIKNINENTPYKDINGMLLRFRLQIKSLDMQLNAKKFEYKTIKDEQFEIPSDYKQITRSQMENIIAQILL